MGRRGNSGGSGVNGRRARPIRPLFAGAGRRSDGSALPLVLAFAAVGLITVTAYLAHQGRSNTAALRSPAALQAALNARSGIYRALDYLIAGHELDSIDSFSYEVDGFFSMDMFDNFSIDESAYGDTDFGAGFDYDDADETYTAGGVGGTLYNYDFTKTILLYTDDSVNTADLSTGAQGLYSRVTSRSAVLDITRYAEALLGCGAPAKPDTALILGNDLPAQGRLRGTVHHDLELGNAPAGTKSVNERIGSFIAGLGKPPLSAEDTAAFGFPITIRSSAEAASIPDTVKAHLTLDGAFSDAAWRERRVITVYGDLQVMGSFRVENLELNVEGEVRILDNSVLSNVHILSAGKIFIGDNAVFQGSAVSMNSINIYGGAEVKKHSTLIAAGAHGTGSKNPSRYSFFLSENSVFDGVAMALGSPGGIKTDSHTKQTGVLWAQKAVCHGGKLTGLIRADYLIDCFDPKGEAEVTPAKVKANVFSGDIEPLPSIIDYKMPFFMGAPQIISMREF